MRLEESGQKSCCMLNTYEANYTLGSDSRGDRVPGDAHATLLCSGIFWLA